GFGLLGLGLGSVLGLLIGFVPNSSDLSRYLNRWPISAILLILLFGFFVLLSGFSSEQSNEEKWLTPDQGIRRSGRITLRIGLVGGLIGELGGGFIGGLIMGLNIWEDRGLTDWLAALTSVLVGTLVGLILLLSGGLISRLWGEQSQKER